MNSLEKNKLKIFRRNTNCEVYNSPLDNKKVQNMLRLAFPLLDSNVVQRKQAGKYLRLIYLYYRMGLSSKEVAVEMRLSVLQIQPMLFRLRYISEGKTANGKVRGVRSRGRPRKIMPQSIALT